MTLKFEHSSEFHVLPNGLFTVCWNKNPKIIPSDGNNFIFSGHFDIWDTSPILKWSRCSGFFKLFQMFLKLTALQFYIVHSKDLLIKNATDVFTHNFCYIDRLLDGCVLYSSAYGICLSIQQYTNKVDLSPIGIQILNINFEIVCVLLRKHVK